MKFSLFSVRSFASIVVNTVCNIGVLLDLSNQASCSDGMDGARINKKYVTFTDISTGANSLVSTGYS